MNIKLLQDSLEGELRVDNLSRILYSTDASAYREMPLAVVFPKSKEDIKKSILFAKENGVTLIPRTAGTSLAGQVVGNGMVVDVSKHLTNILEVDTKECWVRLQPGVVRDELNAYLKNYGLFFGPETSTANRAMIGGMVGNNSCGSNSVVYGSTRDHLLEVQGFLSDGSFVTFSALSRDEFLKKIANIQSKGETSLEEQLYLHIYKMLSNPANVLEIEKEYPKRSIRRRNTGYAIDELLHTTAFMPEEKEVFNFCKLIAGSEGTLFFITEIKLHVNPLPPAFQAVVASHHHTINQSLKANLVSLKYNPSAVELMDHHILECTKANREQRENRFFVDGDPKAILVTEISEHSKEDLDKKVKDLVEDLAHQKLGYHFPVIYGEDIKKVWTLRKAGLGLLGNIPGDEKAVPVIEDTAVDVQDLPAYIEEFDATMAAKGFDLVHYAHAGSGELHLRPIINLKTQKGKEQFKEVAQDISDLVKKYKGSLSGEHGDGRLRGEFIPQQIGPLNYALLKELKQVWDPNNVFNANKIVDTPAMNENLRYDPGQQTPNFKTKFYFKDQNILQHAEQCNGSGDCRKSHGSGGTMCPSYMATKEEKETTRARANMLREALTRVNGQTSLVPIDGDGIERFNNKELKEVLDLCLLCKGCKSECPSNVDMAKLKMEFLYHYQKANGIPLRNRIVANFAKASKVGAMFPRLYNAVFKNNALRRFANKIIGFHPDRTMPLLHGQTLQGWYDKNKNRFSTGQKGLVYFFCDEFTNYNDVPIGIKAIELLHKLGYKVLIPEHTDSGRPYFSKGFLDEAKEKAETNIKKLSHLISKETPLVGVEPSCILAFRDDYPDIVSGPFREAAEKLGENALMIDEFLARELDAKRLDVSKFRKEKKTIKLHGHCQQKAVSSMVPTKKVLSSIEGYTVQLIPSGCCGMSGSFGYEKEHYDISMKIGELVLFPAVRELPEETLVAAPGTSCRHQIHDGTGRTAFHPIEILHTALHRD